MPDSLLCVDFAAEPIPATMPAWPKTPAGTVDWEMVFEHPETGLLACVARAQTPVALREATLTIVHEIYTRRNDEAESQRLSGALNELIIHDMMPGQLSMIAHAITQTFRNIKDQRRKKAAEYERERAEKTAAVAALPELIQPVAAPGKRQDLDRRRRTLAQLSLKQALEHKKQDQHTLTIRGAVAFGFMAAIGASVCFCLGTPPPHTDQILIQLMKSAVAGRPADENWPIDGRLANFRT